MKMMFIFSIVSSGVSGSGSGSGLGAFVTATSCGVSTEKNEKIFHEFLNKGYIKV